jgi:hypothetical protein
VIFAFKYQNQCALGRDNGSLPVGALICDFLYRRWYDLALHTGESYCARPMASMSRSDPASASSRGALTPGSPPVKTSRRLCYPQSATRKGTGSSSHLLQTRALYLTSLSPTKWGAAGNSRNSIYQRKTRKDVTVYSSVKRGAVGARRQTYYTDNTHRMKIVNDLLLEGTHVTRVVELCRRDLVYGDPRPKVKDHIPRSTKSQCQWLRVHGYHAFGLY